MKKEVNVFEHSLEFVTFNRKETYKFDIFMKIISAIDFLLRNLYD